MTVLIRTRNLSQVSPLPSHVYFFCRGTLAPLARASDRPMASSVLRAFTFARARARRSVASLRRRTALATVLGATFRVPLRAVVVTLRVVVLRRERPRVVAVRVVVLRRERPRVVAVRVVLRERVRRVAGMIAPGKKFRTLGTGARRKQFSVRPNNAHDHCGHVGAESSRRHTGPV